MPTSSAGQLGPEQALIKACSHPCNPCQKTHMQTCNPACVKPKAVVADCMLEQIEAELNTVHALAIVLWPGTSLLVRSMQGRQL